MGEPYTLEGPALLMSDLHLNGEARDQSPLGLLKLIAGGALSVTPRHILLVGDVFDFNLGYQRSIYAHLLPVYQLLFALADQGIRLWVFTGNHDPDPCPHLAEREGITVITAPTTFTFVTLDEQGTEHRVTALIEHGDLCEATWVKRSLCLLARATWVRWLARRLPPALALALAPKLPARLNVAQPPVEVNAVAPLQNASLTRLVGRWIEHSTQRPHSALAPSPDLWVMGHFHEARLLSTAQPSCHGLEALEALHASSLQALVILGDWVTLNTCLLIDQGELSLLQYQPQSSPKSPLLPLKRLSITR